MLHNEHVHFIGIGGSGMSGLARVVLEKGIRVSGSDLIEKEITKELEQLGAIIHYEHKEENINGAQMVVYSSDIPPNNVEFLAAQARHIPLLHRSDMLAQLLNERKGIAVAGSHGKTTTTSMLAFLFERAEIEPTYVVGGEVVDLGSNARYGRGEYTIAEADESDKTFLKYHPYIGIVTNISPDHLENYDGDYELLKGAYLQFLQQMKPDGTAILCGDDAVLRHMREKLTCTSVTYGIDADDVDYRATSIVVGDRTSTFTLEHRGETLGTVTLGVAGKHNVYNALATIATALEVGIPFATIAQQMPHFRGAKRRFQVISDANNILIVDDYAVHPTEIKATLAAAKDTGRNVYAVFQPHRMLRAYYLLDQFATAFADADVVLTTEIYSPKGEKKIEGIDAEILTARIRNESNPNTTYYHTLTEIITALRAVIQPGDLVITLGAGDVWKVAKELSRQE